MSRALVAAVVVAVGITGGAVARHHPPAVVTDQRARAPLSAPGALADPAPTVAQLCTVGYSASVRPPVSYTEPIKRRLMAGQHLTGKVSDYELDHEVPLELGGAPRDLRNLWMEPLNGPGGAHAKDVEENQLHHAVCTGSMTLAGAQRRILADWGPR